MSAIKKRAPRNRTLTLTPEECAELENELLRPQTPLSVAELTDKIIWSDFFDVIGLLPERFVDLMIIDPPYNLAKDFNGAKFHRLDNDGYRDYLESWFPKLLPLLKPHASVYLCGDWQCSAAGFAVMNQYLKIRNRITWQREKGRGALRNWKNCCEDIWFATVDADYCFNLDAVKIKRKVIATYRQNGLPKDWQPSPDGNFRLTCPSNFWDDICVPYWSMPENTDHPTQKPEKLIAKLILASSKPGDFIFDPFGGSGTTAATAKKLGRHYAAIEKNREYCCWSQARTNHANSDKNIQGYTDGTFLERNFPQPKA